MVAVDAEEPTDAGMFELEEAGSMVGLADMHNVFGGRAEDPCEHIKEVHADVGGHTAALFHIAFPGAVVPGAAGGDVGEVDIVGFVDLLIC